MVEKEKFVMPINAESAKYGSFLAFIFVPSIVLICVLAAFIFVVEVVIPHYDHESSRANAPVTHTTKDITVKK